jgi:hypothetical protein
VTAISGLIPARPLIAAEKLALSDRNLLYNFLKIEIDIFREKEWGNYAKN